MFTSFSGNVGQQQIKNEFAVVVCIFLARAKVFNFLLDVLSTMKTVSTACK